MLSPKRSQKTTGKSDRAVDLGGYLGCRRFGPVRFSVGVRGSASAGGGRHTGRASGRYFPLAVGRSPGSCPRRHITLT